MRNLLVVAALTLSGQALAADGCDTLAGWSAEACKGDSASASTVLGLAGARLTELGDCSALKKKSDLLACSAETHKLALTVVSAADVVSSAKGPKISRANNNRMEAEDTDE